MKYCSNCGHELLDEAVFCPNCGCLVQKAVVPAVAPAKPETGMQLAAKIFMIISCVMCGICLIPLCWMIPMTVIYFNYLRDRRPVPLAFKICTLLFVSLIAGILMLCDNEDQSA